MYVHSFKSVFNFKFSTMDRNTTMAISIPADSRKTLNTMKGLNN